MQEGGVKLRKPRGAMTPPNPLLPSPLSKTLIYFGNIL